MSMLNQRQKEILNGLMLGDGFLEKAKAGKNACLRITRKLTDKSYNEYHSKIFNNLKVSLKDGKIFDKRTQKFYYQSRLRTSVNTDLTEVWKIWYIDNKKSIPKDLELTPLTIATWFADDGNITIKKGEYSAKFATHGFTFDEVKKLQHLLFNYNLDVKIYEDNSGKFKHWTLHLIGKQNVRNFTQLIDSVFPDGMERKSDLWRNNQDLLTTIIHPSCIYCNSINVYKDGLKTKKQYKCQDCHKMFLTERKRKIRTPITTELIHAVKKEYTNGKCTQKQISNIFLISEKTVSNILLNKYKL